MNIKAIIGIFVGTLAILVGLAWLGQPAGTTSQGAAPTSSVLKSSESRFDFGTISMASGKVAGVFTVTNSSEQPVRIRKIYTSCMCTTATFTANGNTYGEFGMQGHSRALTSANITLNPGESGELEAVYDPNAHGPAGVGPINRFVSIEDANGGRMTVEIKALVTP